MTNKQPESLRLAKIIDEGSRNAYGRQAAAELRRLHEVNTELVKALEQITYVPEDSVIHYKVARSALAKVRGDNNE